MRHRGTTVGAILALTLLLPATAAVGVDSPPSDDLTTARSELDGASRELSEIEISVRRTSDQLSALDDRLGRATTELAGVTADLEQARADLEVARATERATSAVLAEVDGDLDATLAGWHSNQDHLADRVVHAFKHGSATPQHVLVRGVAGANDWHEVAVTLETVGRLTADARTMVEHSVELTRATADLRADAGTARAEALAAIRDAAEVERRVAALVHRQEAVVAAVETDRAARAAVLADLEADAAARAVLVRDLQRRVTELEYTALAAFVPIDVTLDVGGPPPPWASRLPGGGHGYAAAVEATAARYGLDGRLLAALVWTESGFRPGAVSHAGAMGLAQLMPGTARGLGVDPRDPLQNLDGGARYLRSQLDRFGRIDLALAAYNAGPGRVERAGPGIPNIVETQLYVVRVLDRYEQLSR